MKTVEQIRDALRNGRTTFGSWMQVPNASVARIMGSAGYDWIALDLEHGRFSEEQLPGLFGAIETGGALGFARLGEVTAYRIKAALDAGAHGLILPMIES